MKTIRYVSVLVSIVLLSQGLFAQTAEEYVTKYVVVAEQSSDYAELHALMEELSGELSLEIDTMGRGYNPETKLVCLPEDDEDEINAGSYFPRKESGEYLSIEHLDYYDGNYASDAMGLVVLIGSKKDAEGALQLLYSTLDKPFVMKAKINVADTH